MLHPIPAALQRCEFSRLRFFLEIQENVTAGSDVLLRLRRDLRQAARETLGRGSRFELLFDPPLAEDPVARRRFQRPGPAFVLLPPEPLPDVLDAGDCLPLTVVFWGRGRQGIPDFIRVLQTFGACGLHRGEGRFELVAVEGDAPVGSGPPLWRPGTNPDRLAAPVHEARWWLETAFEPRFPVDLEFRTPARLMSDGRPLFRPDFRSLFPFMLRRVTSMLYAQCGVEPVADPGSLLASAADVEESANTLAWRDWRVLEGDGKRQQVGGVVGSLRLDGAALANILWVLQLCTLMNLGKGAAFASGNLQLFSGS